MHTRSRSRAAAPSAASRSSSMRAAERLAVEAEHASRLADIERAAAERIREAAERIATAEKSASERRMQAELAAVEAGSSRGSNRGSRSSHSTVDQWLEGIPRPLEPAAIIAQEPSQPASFSSAPSHIQKSTTAPLSPRVIERGDIGLSHRATTSGIPHVFQAGDAMQAHPQAWGPYDTNVAAPPGPLPAFQEVGVTSALPQAGASLPPGPYPAFQEVGVTSAPPQAGVFFSAGLGASLGQHPLAAPPVRLLGRSLPADAPVTQPAPTATTSSHMPHHMFLGTHHTDACNNLNKNYKTDTLHLAEAVAQVAAAAATRTSNQKVSALPLFDGRPTEWLIFKRSYDDTCTFFSSSENLARLNAALRGPAREAVVVLLAAARDPQEVLRVLESSFARPEHIILAEVAKVRALPRLSSAESTKELSAFALKVLNCKEIVRLLNRPEYLASPELCNEIIFKLTPLLRSRWADFAVQHSSLYRLESLADFLMREADLRVRFGAFIEPFHSKSFTKVTCNATDCYTEDVSPKDRSAIVCLFCTKCHLVRNCEKFRALSIQKRLHWVAEAKVCRKCLERGSHHYNSCNKFSCKEKSCKFRNSHHTLLHKPIVNDATLVTQPVDHPSSSSQPVDPSTSLYPDSSSIVVTHSYCPSANRPLLKVIPVTLSGPNGSFNTFALLDDGSTATLLDASVAERLGIVGRKSRIRVDGVSGMSTETDVSFIDLRVKGQFSTKYFDLKNVRSIPNLNLQRQTIPKDEVERISYVSDLADVVCYEDAVPTLLIGVDNWEITIPQCIRRGSRRQPIAVQTSLGWVLYGSLKGNANSSDLINHCIITESSQSLDDQLRDSKDTSNKTYFSRDDRDAVNICRLPSGKFQTGPLLKPDIGFVPNSYVLAHSSTLSTPPKKLCKRSVLAFLMRAYQPLRLLTSIVVKDRVIFQRTWKLGIDWDTELPVTLSSEWNSWFSNLTELFIGSIPRHYLRHKQAQSVQLHVLADASELAYACVAYWRFECTDGSVMLSLIGGKARLAPVKPQSIPRLELQAALIAARFATYILEAHERKPEKVFYWTDSLTVLRWLRNDSRSFKSFVAHRIGEIDETTSVTDWRYVPSALNVADDATRVTKKIETTSRWFTGPDFLSLPQDEWPVEPSCHLSPIVEEYKQSCLPSPDAVGCTRVNPIPSPIQMPSPITANVNRFSSWIRLLRATIRIHRCAKIFKLVLSRCQGHNLPSHSTSSFTAAEFKEAERLLLLRSQLNSFQQEYALALRGSSNLPARSRLSRLAFELDPESNLLCLSSRILTAGPSEIVTKPIILDGKEPIVRLLISYHHQRAAHGFNELVVNELKQQYFILGLRPAVRSISSACFTCKINKGRPYVPPVGDLPPERLAYHSRPFTCVGVDHFGPITVSIGRRSEKRYVALFTCLTVRAVHLEVQSDLSSDSTIMSLRRFIARRGTPSTIYSDNGTSFVGANRILSEALANFSSERGIHWKFIVPAAPFMGGAWERLVRTIKCALCATLRGRNPREEVLLTLLAEAEGLVNSRPLSYVSVEAGTSESITPYHFLLGQSSPYHRVAEVSDDDLIRRIRWRKGLRLADHFWSRWVREYLPTLAPRPRGNPARPLTEGDLVLVVDGNLPRGVWLKGRISKTFPGKDGVVRAVEVTTSTGVLKRPVRNLVLI